MSESTETLLRRLLPEIYWQRDASSGRTLAALTALLAAEYDALREGVEALYDNVFLQTCDEDIVPYFAEMLGVTGLSPATRPGVSNRAWVGSIIALRVRKGTLAAAARGAGAASGWALFARDGRLACGRMQPVRFDDRAAVPILDLAAPGQVRDLRTPWSRAARSADLGGRPLQEGRPVADAPGEAPHGPAPQSIAISVWRLRAFPVRGRTPHPVAGHAGITGRAFTFDPMGLTRRLFQVPAEPEDSQRLPSAEELPLPLTVARLADLLATPHHTPPLAIRRTTAEGRHVRIERAAIEACDLSHWAVPVGSAAEVLVDPVTGRLLFTSEIPDEVSVDYAYGAVGEIGGGPYVAGYMPATYVPGARLQTSQTLAAALGDRRSVILIPDSRTHAPPPGGWTVSVAKGASVTIAAAPGAAPVLAGDIYVTLDDRAQLKLRGLTITGTVSVRGSGQLTIAHCTLLPHGRRSVRARSTGPLYVTVSFSIVGRIAGGGLQLNVADSVVDGHGEAAVDLRGEAQDAGLIADRITALGAVHTPVVTAQDSIFAGPLHAPRGLAANSYLPADSDAPELIDCERRQPPLFTSTAFADATYAQLHPRCPLTIARGARDGGEMGVFNWLGQPERMDRLPIVLHELLPAGMAASVSYLT